ncbi:unnamed protein product [Sphenostylis stenocarpa]|uniref:Uncharacterized protein n=1 Tax=Sphenostylis stenocarpa TaxID=92480 RepID=A0AA86VUM3_9FABA|nr:unnamed protein product [Sphenostylis stenocarpa]
MRRQKEEASSLLRDALSLMELVDLLRGISTVAMDEMGLFDLAGATSISMVEVASSSPIGVFPVRYINLYKPSYT